MNALVDYQHCERCRHDWYFRRPFCPRCGATDRLAERHSDGAGTVHAVTTIFRAPTEELRALAPYTAVLVDLDDGFRVMGHGDPALVIGDLVEASRRRFGEVDVLFFTARTR